MTDLKKEKLILRQKYLQIRRSIPTEAKKRYERMICSNFTGCASYKYYDTLLLYAALPDEPDLSAIALKALSDGKRVAYPCCIPQTRNLVFRFVKSTADLVPGHYGIPEPTEDCPVFDPSLPCCSVCLVPAVAVDRSGYRIGYGGGYYDRFLPVFGGSRAAVTFSCLIADRLPHGKYDLRTDVIITEGGILTIDEVQA